MPTTNNKSKLSKKDSVVSISSNINLENDERKILLENIETLKHELVHQIYNVEELTKQLNHSKSFNIGLDRVELEIK